MSISKDPVRLVLDPTCPDRQRELLQHGTSLEPPREAEQAVWLGLAGALGAATVGAAKGTSTPSTTAKAAKATATKLVVAVLALGALAGMVALGSSAFAPAKAPPPVEERGASPSPAGLRPATSPHFAGRGADEEQPREQRQSANEPQPFALAPRQRRGPPTESAGVGGGVRWTREGQGEGSAPRRRRVSSQPIAPAAAPLSATEPREETASIEEARQALRSGDPTRALKLLEECRRRFPAGVLAQERELLTIQALVSAVRGSEARARAAAFVRKYPHSPHAGEIRALGLGAPEAR